MQITESHERTKTEGCKDCNDDKNLTQIAINKERVKVCDLLYESHGKTFGLNEKYKGEKEILVEKKCLYVKTQQNYHRYRNFEILVTTQLLQANDSVKTNVTTYSKINKDLNAALKNIAKSIKDVKGKFEELKQAADKLGSCKDDPCNAAQWKAITGQVTESSKNPECKSTEPIPECKNAHQIYYELMCRPGGLLKDINSIFSAAHNVAGIQWFTSIDLLDPLQKKLDELSKDFGKHISEVAKTRGEDVKKLQEELIKSVQEISKAGVERNHERSNFEGYKETTEFLCCPPCTCLKKGDTIIDWKPSRKYDPNDRDYCKDISIAVLGECESQITKICEEVQKGFCCKPPVPGNNPNPPNPC